MTNLSISLDENQNLESFFINGKDFTEVLQTKQVNSPFIALTTGQEDTDKIIALVDFLGNVVDDFIESAKDGKLTSLEIAKVIVENSLEGFAIGKTSGEIILELRDLDFAEIIAVLKHSSTKFRNLNEEQQSYIAEVLNVAVTVRTLVLDAKEVW